MKTDEKMELLGNLGLNEQEIVVYTGLLKMGGSGASELAKEVNMKRTTVYPILEGLVKKTIVSSYKRGASTFFTPLTPSKLVSLYENKLESLIRIVPALEKLQGTQTKAYGVRFIQSKRELEAFYNEVLDDYRDKSYRIIGNANVFINIDPDVMLGFIRKRALRNIHTKLLLSHDSRSAGVQSDSSLLREFKYLGEKYKFKSTIDIYDDKILIIGPELNALAVVIAIPPMVDIFKSIFDVLWENVG
ncbi:hypothetical protein COB55_00670 [Candidatus Wolfebacteria bacterium]|nr:MAG: hypothetical protein COB55_00670 [Candidatus Wolfebacteria bacterium]